MRIHGFIVVARPKYFQIACVECVCILVCAPRLHRTTNYIGSRRDAQRVPYLPPSFSFHLHISISLSLSLSFHILYAYTLKKDTFHQLTQTARFVLRTHFDKCWTSMNRNCLIIDCALTRKALYKWQQQ